MHRSNVEGGFAVSMPKPLSELVQKPRRVQTGFKEAKRTIVVARYPGVEVNNATHHVGETGAAPHRCKSHPLKAILLDPFVPFDDLTFTRSSMLLAIVSLYFAIVRVYRYLITPLSKSIIFARRVCQTTLRFDFNTRCEFEEWYFDTYHGTRIRKRFVPFLPRNVW